MSDRLTPDGEDAKTVAYTLYAIATAIDFTRKMHWASFSELDREVVETLVRQLSEYAAALEAKVSK